MPTPYTGEGRRRFEGPRPGGAVCHLRRPKLQDGCARKGLIDTLQLLEAASIQPKHHDAGCVELLPSLAKGGGHKQQGYVDLRTSEPLVDPTSHTNISVPTFPSPQLKHTEEKQQQQLQVLGPI